MLLQTKGVLTNYVDKISPIIYLLCDFTDTIGKIIAFIFRRIRIVYDLSNVGPPNVSLFNAHQRIIGMMT